MFVTDKLDQFIQKESGTLRNLFFEQKLYKFLFKFDKMHIELYVNIDQSIEMYTYDKIENS